MGYYQGDFYRGDPGFFSSLGRIFKGVASTVAGVIPGVGGTVGRAITKIGGGSKIGGIVKSVGGAIIKHPVLSAAGAAGAVGAAGTLAGRHLGIGTGESMMKGHHLSRKTGKLVRNRHMNPCNPRALRRAIRRTHSFARLAMRTIHLVHPKKKARFGGFKRRRKSK